MLNCFAICTLARAVWKELSLEIGQFHSRLFLPGSAVGLLDEPWCAVF